MTETNDSKILNSEESKQVGERLHGLREVLDIKAEEAAEVCGIPVEHYLAIENGERDASVYVLKRMARRYGVSLDVLLYGEDSVMSSYFLTRRGYGKEASRRKAYKYTSLASGFRGRKVDPFVVEIAPRPDDKRFSKNSHDGQEFNIVMEGHLEISIGNRTMELNPGDSIYFDATQPHCMRALDGKPVKFLCVII